MCFSGWGGKERAWEIITDDVAGFQGPKISDFGALKMTNIIILSVSRESVNYESASTIWGGGARPTGVDKRVSSDCDQFP